MLRKALLKTSLKPAWAGYSKRAQGDHVQSTEDHADPLLDRHGRQHTYLRVSLTERCNLRCQYCMPAEGVALSPRAHLLTTDELLRLAALFAAQGVTKLRLTGGEPTVRRDLAPLVGRLKAVKGLRSVSMTTNGLTLTRQLVELQRAGLDALNVSLDTLRPDRYQSMARRKGLERVLAGVDLALQLGYSPLKLNCVVMKDFNEDEVCDFVEMTRERAVDVRFIEFMPFSGNEWKNSRLVSYRSMLRAVFERFPDFTPLPNPPHDTSKAWHVPGHAGRVGFISSMTEHFCHSCNRLRLMADGSLKVCLFGAAEVSLRDAVRASADDAALLRLIGAAVARKQPRHAAPRRAASRAHVRSYGTAAGAGEGAGERLSHVDAEGRARMVDVGHKPVTARVALAECSVLVGAHVQRLLEGARLPKGDVLSVAQLAGVMGAKRAAELIPLCHPLALDAVHVQLELRADRVLVRCEARCTGRTGAEMEALTGAAVAALTVYDMCKAADKSIRITDLRLLSKSGGRSDFRLRALDTAPAQPRETYAPTNFMHL